MAFDSFYPEIEGSIEAQVYDTDNNINRVIDTGSGFILEAHVRLKILGNVDKYHIGEIQVKFYLEPVGLGKNFDFQTTEMWEEGKEEYVFSKNVAGGTVPDGTYKVTAVVTFCSTDNRALRIAGFHEVPLIQMYSMG